jgi:hypothetical protein
LARRARHTLRADLKKTIEAARGAARTCAVLSSYGCVENPTQAGLLRRRQLRQKNESGKLSQIFLRKSLSDMAAHDCR